MDRPRQRRRRVTPLGSGSTVTVRLYAPNVSEANTHEIRMTAYDSAGNIRSDTITVTVSGLF